MIVRTVECDDWVQLYVEDTSVYEGHSLPHFFLMPHLLGGTILKWERFELLPDKRDEEAEQMNVDDFWFHDKFSEYDPTQLRLIEGDEVQ